MRSLSDFLLRDATSRGAPRFVDSVYRCSRLALTAELTCTSVAWPNVEFVHLHLCGYHQSASIADIILDVVIIIGTTTGSILVAAASARKVSDIGEQ